MRRTLIYTAFMTILLLSGYNRIAQASSQVGLAWETRNDQFVLDTVTARYRVTERWAFRADYNWESRDLAAGVLYQPQPLKRLAPYIGVGLRDITGTHGTGYTAIQKTEIISGFEYDLNRFVSWFSVAMEARVVPDSLVSRAAERDNPFRPILTVSVNYRLPGGNTVPGREPGPVSESDLNLLARLITAEAGSEPYEGQVAVGAVVLNRIRSGRFPTTVREVIYQPGQFSSLPKLDRIEPSEVSLSAAREALRGVDPSRGAIFFYNPATCSPAGIRFFTSGELRVTTRIGNHVFLTYIE